MLRTADNPRLKGCFPLDWKDDDGDVFFVLCVDQIE
jgi:hypothetical protein